MSKIEYLSTSDRARYQLEWSASGVVSDDKEKPVNSSFCNALAASEGARILNSLKDRYVGIYTTIGYFPMTPLGHVSSVIYSMSPGAGLETIIDARDVPPMPTIEQTVGQEHISFLRQQVTNVRTNPAEMRW